MSKNLFLLYLLLQVAIGEMRITNGSFLHYRAPLADVLLAYFLHSVYNTALTVLPNATESSRSYKKHSVIAFYQIIPNS